MVVQGAVKGALQVSDAFGGADGSEFPLDVDMIMEVVVAVSLTPARSVGWSVSPGQTLHTACTYDGQHQVGLPIRAPCSVMTQVI